MVWLRAVRLAVTFFIYTIHLTRPPKKNTHKNKKGIDSKINAIYILNSYVNLPSKENQRRG